MSFAAVIFSIAILFPLPSRGETPPQEPDWDQSAPSATSDPSHSPQIESAESSSPGNAKEASSSEPAVEEASSSDPTETIGVPEKTNFFLPNFRDYGRSIFERQGLKFRLGPLNLRPSLSLSYNYTDNVFGSPNAVPDYVTSISPGFLLGMGDFNAKTEDFLALDYKPSLDFYAEHPDQNRVNQNLQLTGQLTMSRYSGKIDFDYSSNNQPNATQSGGQSYSNLRFGMQNRYFLGAKTFGQANLDVLVQDSENNNNYQTFVFSPSIGYAYSPKTTVFVGPFAGIAFIGEGGTQTFQGIGVGFEYTNLRKININGNLGVQARQFRGLNVTGAQDFITPVYSLGISYLVSTKTQVGLIFSRNVQISDLVRGLTYTTSEIHLNWSQKLRDNLTFGLEVAYQILDYQGGRGDQTYISASPTLGYTFWKGAFTISATYRRQQRTSDVEAFEYTKNTYGIGISYNF